MRFITFTLLFSIFLSPSVSAQANLSIIDIVRELLHYDPQITVSLESLNMAEHTYQKNLADTAPSFKLNDTGYSLSKSKDTLSNTFSLGVSYNQKLPTSGSLELKLKDSLTIQTEDGEEPQYKQKPSISLSVVQPLFFNGKLIDFDVYPATIRKAEIDMLKSREDSAQAMNLSILDAVTLFYSIIEQRKLIAYQGQRLSWHIRDLNNLEKKMNLNLATETEVWEKKLDLGDLEETIYSGKMNLARDEKILAHSLRLDDVSTLFFDDSIPEIALIDTDDELARQVLNSNSTITKNELALETARIQTILSDLSYTTSLSTSITFIPSYPASTWWSTSLSNSITDFAEENSDYNFSLVFTLSIPLYDGGKRKHAREIDISSEQIAFENLHNQKATILRDLELGLFRRKNLMEKISLLQDHVDLNRKQVDIQKKLFELEQITELEVISVELDLINQQNKLWRARADLFLATLEIHSQLGQNLENLIAE